MLPVVALVGRPNVGKSTLFNRITHTRDAIVSSLAGTTRDRQYGEAYFQTQKFILIDTGGISDLSDPMNLAITQQAELAMKEADFLLFVVDARSGLHPEDLEFSKSLRKLNKSIYVVINKVDGMDESDYDDFHRLGFSSQFCVSASHGFGVETLLETLFPPKKESETDIAISDTEANSKTSQAIKIAFIGKPNVGKSTLTNRILGEERVIVHDASGTTRDSIYIPLQRFEKEYLIIDTAGVRRKARVHEQLEKFSVVKTLKSIEDAHVVLYIIDGKQGVSDADLKILHFILECGKALVIAVNKWDGLSTYEREQTRASLDRHLNFLDFARTHFISALHGSGVGNVFDSIDEAFQSASTRISTNQVNVLLQQAIESHSPPLIQGRRVKLRYAHFVGTHPPKILIHGTRLSQLPMSYVKYLERFFQKKLKLHGILVRMEFKENENPYA